MSGPAVGACDPCIRRAWLVASLSGLIEAAVGARPSRRTRELLALGDAELGAALSGKDGEVFVERAREREPARLREAVRGAHCWACCRHDEHYPAALRDLSDSPAALFGRGDPALLGSLPDVETATVVGARRPSAYGREMAGLLGRELAFAGLAVVSGMAFGIDSCAHRGALDGEGLTVAVLGGGPDQPHPAGVRSLYEEIVERGVVISELPPGTTPRRWTFPARNRIMAALGAITVVVEARSRSGSLITSEIAQDLGRDLGAVPGQVGHSVAAGTNDLLNQGAQVVRSGQDVLDSLLGPGVRSVKGGGDGPDLGHELATVLDAVEAGAATQDEVSRAVALDPGTAVAGLAQLELLGLIACDSAGRYRRTTRAGA